jgi:alkaline phosphatase
MALFHKPFEIAPVVKKAIAILSRNPKGYFLMVEWYMHTDNVKRGLDNALAMDGVIAQTAEQVKGDTFDLLHRRPLFRPAHAAG